MKTQQFPGESGGDSLPGPRYNNEMDQESALAIEWPWEMVPMEAIDEVIDWIKGTLPSDHELQGHDLFPGIKYDGRMVFIVDDDTAGHSLLMDFENGKSCGKTRRRVPAVKVFKDRAEVAELIRRDSSPSAKTGCRNRKGPVKGA